MAVKVLKRVHAGELPFDRTVQVSVTDRLEKDQILGRFPHNLRTVEILLKQNRDDYRIATSKSYKHGAAPRGMAPFGPPPPPRRAAGRGVRPAHPADRADDQDAGGVQPPRRRRCKASRSTPTTQGQGAAAEQREPWIVEYRNILRPRRNRPPACAIASRT